MGLSVEQQAASYPLAAYNFRVAVDDVAMSFAEAGGLTREFEVLTYRHGMSFLEGEDIVRFRLDKFVPVTLKQGIVRGASGLLRWFEQGDRRIVSISLCDEAGAAVLSWRLQKAVPTKLEWPTLQAATNEAAVQTLTLMAAGITVVDHA